MRRKIFKTGNSVVVSLPKNALNFLGIAEGAEVSVKLNEEQRQIVITPIDPNLPGVDARFSAQVAQFIDQYRPALEALAK